MKYSCRFLKISKVINTPFSKYSHTFYYAGCVSASIRPKTRKQQRIHPNVNYRDNAETSWHVACSRERKLGMGCSTRLSVLTCGEFAALPGRLRASGYREVDASRMSIRASDKSLKSSAWLQGNTRSDKTRPVDEEERTVGPRTVPGTTQQSWRTCPHCHPLSSR